MAARVVKRGSGPSELPMQFHSQPTHAAAAARPQKLVYALTFACVVLLTTVLALLTGRAAEPSALGQPSHQALSHLTDIDNLSPPDQTGNIFVSYSYFEKDPVQKANFEFFLLAAMGVGSVLGRDTVADYYLIINGEECSPCKALDGILQRPVNNPMEGVAWVQDAPHITMLKRIENEGMDFAAHNTSMTFAMQHREFWNKYKYFIFLNSSVKGPFTPKYYPFHWSQTYLSRLKGNVKAVSSSIVCLPDVDAGGPGPRMESWAFAMDDDGLKVALARGVYNERTCKLCTDGVVVMGEYGLSISLMAAGYTFDTLMYKYGNVDWHDEDNWNCNNQAHPSRHGTYDAISMHPFEVVFLKASWHVGVPFNDKYAAWQTKKLRGKSTTTGQFDEPMYRWAITPEAQDEHPLLQKAYQVIEGRD